MYNNSRRVAMTKMRGEIWWTRVEMVVVSVIGVGSLELVGKQSLSLSLSPPFSVSVCVCVSGVALSMSIRDEVSFRRLLYKGKKMRHVATPMSSGVPSDHLWRRRLGKIHEAPLSFLMASRSFDSCCPSIRLSSCIKTTLPPGPCGEFKKLHEMIYNFT